MIVIKVKRTSCVSRVQESKFKISKQTCVSGSPNLQLYSSTLGPSFVNIRPAYKTPETAMIMILTFYWESGKGVAGWPVHAEWMFSLLGS